MRKPRSRPVHAFLLLGAALVTLVAAAVLGHAASRASAAAADLFVSEYVEGSSTNKAIELFNGTGGAVSLDGVYDLQIYGNGSATATATIALAGTVAAGEVFVLARAGSAAELLAAADQTTTNFLFNGNDAIALRRDGVVIDVIGQIGDDPGAAWAGGGVSTQDGTMRRKADVMAGDPDGSDPFDPAAEWDGFPPDTFDGLGAHEAGEDPPTDPPAADPCDAEPTISGTDRHDILFGTHGDDIIHAGAGHDLVFGLGGDDVICGGPGRDILIGNRGDDTIIDDSGRTWVFGGGGSDRVTTGPDADRIWGGFGDDVIEAGDGRDRLFGGPGADTLDGGPAPDLLVGGRGQDTCTAEPEDYAIRCE